MKPSIGQTENGKDLVLDVDRLLETRLLVQSNSGGGKSHTLRRVFEQTADKVQQIILDTEGEFSTLRHKFDYVICAPQGADAIATPATAALLARRLRETRVSAIIDMYDLKMPNRRRFVRLFLEELIEAPKSMWHPVLVGVDEAHLYCPEKGEAESASAVIDLSSRGRKRGLCALLATQRLSKLHKDAAAELLNKMVGRTGLDVDVKRAADELGLNYKEAFQLLRSLDPGHFYCFGPALSKSVINVKVGCVQTKAPKAGSGSTTPPAPSEKIKTMLAKLTDLPKEAATEARTLADLKSENTKLKRELTFAKKDGPKLPATEIKRIEVPVVGKRAYAGIKECAVEMRKAMNKIVSIHKAWEHNLTVTNSRIDGMIKTLEKVGEQQKQSGGIEVYKPAGPAWEKVSKWTQPIKQQQKTVLTTSGDIQLGRCERSILTVLATHGPCQRGRLALLAGYSWSGSFSNSLGALRTHQYITGGNSETMNITDTGVVALGNYDPLPTGQALRDYWLNRFGKCERAILQSLFNHPEGLDKDQLCEKSGYTWSGSFSNSLGALRTAGVIVGSNSSVIRASEELLNG